MDCISTPAHGLEAKKVRHGASTDEETPMGRMEEEDFKPD
jgi:hypothetical protein